MDSSDDLIKSITQMNDDRMDHIEDNQMNRLHSRERLIRRGYRCLSVVMTWGLTIMYTPELFERRREPLPSHRALVWLDPTEVRVNGLWIGRRGSFRRNYPLRLVHLNLFLIPGMRPHEAKERVQRSVGLWLLTIMGVIRGHSWRVPMSWTFFEGWSSGVTGRVAEPRLSHYVEWWVTWNLWMVGRCHAPWRVTMRLTKWRSMGYSLSYGLRRYSFLVSLIRGARVTPPDVGSQRRVAIPRMGVMERCVLMLRYYQSLTSITES